MDDLLGRLQQIATQHLEDAPLHAYLITHTGEKFYGLDQAGLRGCYTQYQAETSSISLFLSHRKGAVLRLSVRFHAHRDQASGQFVIATHSRRLNRLVEAILLGQAPPVSLPTDSVISSKAVPVEEMLRQPQMMRPPAFQRPMQRFFSQPVSTLNDYFFFSPAVSADQMMDMLNALSQRFMGGALFHVRLETLDGDFHIHMDRQALRYMLSQQHERLLMLYMDAATAQGEWINIRLSYHPLMLGPNAEVDLTTRDPDEVLSCIQEYIGVEAPDQVLPGRTQLNARIPKADFSLTDLMQTVQWLSVRILQRIPPVAFLATQDGVHYTGLSFFQLETVFKRHAAEAQMLAIGVNQIQTGQNCTLVLRFDHPEWIHLTWCMMWGAERIHKQVEKHLADGLLWEEIAKPEPTSLPLVSHVTPSCLLALPGLGPQTAPLQKLMDAVLEPMGYEAIKAHAYQAHQQWEDTMRAMASCTCTIADLSFKYPEVLYQISLAEALGKPVLLLIRRGGSLPEELRHLPVLQYEQAEPDTLELRTAIRKFMQGVN
ncbi:MAG: hypothetical protein AAFV07_09350 [Bacteroidota bacterium]